MANVIVDKNKIDLLANAISAKSGEPLTLTLDEMVDAVDGIETGGGGIAPTGNIDITQAGVTDVTNYATATVPSASFFVVPMDDPLFYTEDSVRKWRYRATVEIDPNEGDNAGWIDEGVYHSEYNEMYAVPSNTSITPTESAQTIGAANTMMEGAVTVNAIPSNYVGTGITRRDSTDLTASGATVSVPSGYYGSNATKSVDTMTLPTAASAGQPFGYTTKATLSRSSSDRYINIPTGYNSENGSYKIEAVPNGTEGTPTATKGTVTNHSVTVTPSVTNSAGYISGGTHTGTGVSVSASELVSGSQTVTENDTYDVTNLATLVVNVSGGSSTVAVGTKTATLSASSSSIQFTGLSGNPTSFVVTSSADQSTGGTKVVAVAWDGTSFHGMDVTTQAESDTGFTKSYSSGTLTITATTASFQANEYKLVYTYGGSSSDIHTADVQVGSGATSITFSSLSGRPIYYSCVFKSSFSTSSGYQRVIAVANDGTNTYGHAFDSSAKAQTSWTSSYSGGSLTITSSGTNNGGYFHQPGYYQLTYAVDDSAPSYQTKSAYATTSAQTITADNGYDALEQVNLGAISQTNLTAGNIKSGTTISISNGSTNLWSVTGTYEGGGGGSLTVATKTLTNTAISRTLSFTSLSGEPKYWFLRATTNVSSSGSTTYYYITDLFYDGTNIKGNTFRIGSTRRVQNITSGVTQSYSDGTLTITAGSASTATPGQFYGASNFGYELVYIY